MSSAEFIGTVFATAYSGLLAIWHSLVNLDRTSLLGVGLFLAAFSSTLQYTREVVYKFAQMTCLSSVRINDDGHLFHYVMGWITETQFSSAHHNVEASVPFANTWQDEADAAAALVQYGDVDTLSYRVRVEMRPIHYQPFAGRHLFWYKGRPIVFGHHEWHGIKPRNTRQSLYHA